MTIWLPFRMFSNQVVQCQNSEQGDNGFGFERASTEQLRTIFLKYASQRRNNEYFMTNEDFVCKFLGLYTSGAFNDESVRLLASIADTSKDGLISFEEFQKLEGLLCAPDALYKTAFQLFDRRGKGSITYADFAEVVQKTEMHSKIPYNLDSTLMRRYFGKQKSGCLEYAEFTQLLHDFRMDYAAQAFRSKDKYGKGFITPSDFEEINFVLKGQTFADYTPAVTIDQRVSYPYSMAFISLVNNMDLIKRIYLFATDFQPRMPISKAELFDTATQMSEITPLQMDILFQLHDKYRRKDRIVYSDLCKIHRSYEHRPLRLADNLIETVANTPTAADVRPPSLWHKYLSFALAAIFGATLTYPFDLIATRLQYQRNFVAANETFYKHALDCYSKTLQNNGLRGLYRGLLPLTLLVAPEQALKLGTNFYLRNLFGNKKNGGRLRLHQECVAGGAAGVAKVIFTNPMEIIKIRMQLADVTGMRSSVSSIVRDLGVFGLYRSARACLMRDIPFYAAYFPIYAHTKSKLASKDGTNSALSLFTAGALSAVPTSLLTSPIDIIKTRLHAVSRFGESLYGGVRDASRKIMQEEGISAFWKGSATRILRTAPQFGVTMLSFELLQRILIADTPSAPIEQPKPFVRPVEPGPDDHIGGFRAAVPLLYAIRNKFGFCLPCFQHAPT